MTNKMTIVHASLRAWTADTKTAHSFGSSVLVELAKCVVAVSRQTPQSMFFTFCYGGNWA